MGRFTGSGSWTWRLFLPCVSYTKASITFDSFLAEDGTILHIFFCGSLQSFAKSARGHFPSVYSFMFCNMFTASCVVLLYMLISGQKVTFDRDINHGMYGFLNSRYDRLPLELYMVGVLGTALQFIDCGTIRTNN